MMSGAKSVPIIDIVRHYSGVELKQKGKEYWGSCPFHNERTPSFSVNPAKNIWHCFSCGAGGSSVDFVMKLKNLSFPDACLHIEADFHLCRDGWQRPAKKTNEQTRASIISALDRKINEVFDFCFTSRIALLAEMKRHNEPPARMVHDLGLCEIVMEEIASGEPERVITALNLFGGRKRKNGKQCSS